MLSGTTLKQDKPLFIWEKKLFICSMRAPATSLLGCLVPYQLDDALQVRSGLGRSFTNDLHKGDDLNDIADSKSCGVWQWFHIEGTNIITKSHISR